MEEVLNPIYERFRYYRGESSFEITLRLLQELLNERLVNSYTKIRVFGSNSKLVRLGFRQDLPIESESKLIEDIISNLSRGCLSGVISGY